MGSIIASSELTNSAEADALACLEHWLLGLGVPSCCPASRTSVPV